MPNWKKLIVSGSDATLNSLNVNTSLEAQSLTGSLAYSNLVEVPQGIISQSSQVNITQTVGYNTFSSSLSTEKQRIDAILLASDADTDTFAEIVSLINSVDTDNDNTFASFYTASNGRLGALESYTASLDSTTLISGSSQINITGTTGYISFSSSIADSIGAISTDFADITGKPSLVSGSSQIYFNGIQNVPSGIISSSTQINGNLNVSSITANTFTGDGSGLTNVSTSITEYTTVEEAFTDKLTIVVPHNFGTKNVIVSVYDNNDAQIIPQSVVTSTANQVTITFIQSTTGRVVVAKGGHIVSGSIQMFTHREDLSGSLTYTITHNLDEDYPIVQLYGTDKKQVIPKDIESVSNNVVIIEFSESFDGKVVIKK